MASREALQKLIQFGDAEQFATHAEDWSACSSTAILNAAVEKLGKLTQQRAYKDNVGTTVQDWNARRTELVADLRNVSLLRVDVFVHRAFPHHWWLGLVGCGT